MTASFSTSDMTTKRDEMILRATDRVLAALSDGACHTEEELAATCQMGAKALQDILEFLLTDNKVEPCLSEHGGGWKLKAL